MPLRADSHTRMMQPKSSKGFSGGCVECVLHESNDPLALACSLAGCEKMGDEVARPVLGFGADDHPFQAQAFLWGGVTLN